MWRTPVAHSEPPEGALARLPPRPPHAPPPSRCPTTAATRAEAVFFFKTVMPVQTAQRLTTGGGGGGHASQRDPGMHQGSGAVSEMISGPCQGVPRHEGGVWARQNRTARAGASLSISTQWHYTGAGVYKAWARLPLLLGTQLLRAGPRQR